MSILIAILMSGGMSTCWFVSCSFLGCVFRPCADWKSDRVCVARFFFVSGDKLTGAHNASIGGNFIELQLWGNLPIVEVVRKPDAIPERNVVSVCGPPSAGEEWGGRFRVSGRCGCIFPLGVRYRATRICFTN